MVGQTFGKPPEGEYVKIYLNPGWEFTKKSYEGKVLGHFFFSGDSQAIAAASGTEIKAPVAASFSDISRDIYKDEIEEAVALGFISGYKDKTFKPTEPLTREQLVSIVYDALGTIDGMELQPADMPSTQPYPDVESDRWSAGKIAWAASNNIVTGYQDNTFKPSQPVTRAELMAVLNKVALFADEGKTELVASKEPVEFSDTTNHWASDTIKTMSAYCGVASPYQETGDSFQPNSPAARHYAAAATLRTRECLTKEE